MVTWSTMIPIDYVKTQIQRSKTPTTIMKVVRDTIKSGGVLRLWNGVLPATIRIGPVSGLGMVAYEMACKYVKNQ
jgi:hypothetical protein